MVSNLLKSYSYLIPKNVLNYRKYHFESGYFSHNGKDNWTVCSMVRKLFRLYRKEINLKAGSSFSLNMTKKTFKHNNSRDNILYITITLTRLYSDNLPSLISNKTPLLKIVPSAI